MSLRNSLNSSDYPEHLNPFREEDGDEDHFQHKFNTVGRRKSRTSLNVTSWTLLQTIKAKPVERDATFLPKLTRNKFMTMTPKISRHLMEMLSSRRNQTQNKSLTSSPVGNKEQFFSTSEFRIMPKSSRLKFALRSETGEPDADLARRSACLDQGPRPRSKEFEFTEAEVTYSSHGAKPKKKRQAPLPPPLPTSNAPIDTAVKELPTSVRDDDEALTHQGTECNIQAPLPPQSPTSNAPIVTALEELPTSVRDDELSVDGALTTHQGAECEK